MLTPYICVVCEKVVFSVDDVASLIRLFTKMTVAVPSGAQIPPRNAVVPKEWAVFAVWDYKPDEDVEKEVFACADFRYPDGTLFGPVSKIAMNIPEGKNRVQVMFQFQAFPIGQTGELSVRVWLEQKGEVVGDHTEIKIALEISQSTENK